VFPIRFLHGAVFVIFGPLIHLFALITYMSVFREESTKCYVSFCWSTRSKKCFMATNCRSNLCI